MNCIWKLFLGIFGIFWNFFTFEETFALPVSNDECVLRQSGIYVSISADAEIFDTYVVRWIEIHWWGIETQGDDDLVGFWSEDPEKNPDGMIESYAVVGVDGNATTTVRFNSTDYPQDVPNGTVCLPYWAGYMQNGSLVFTACLTLYPRWMEEMKEDIEGFDITEIIIPGSHNAGAYIGEDGDQLIPMIGRWVYTQDGTIWQQLIHGQRYFDIRISYNKNTTEKFYLSHADIPIRPLVVYLEDFSRFLNETNEIVIFDIHYLGNNFGISEKEALSRLLEQYFMDWMVPGDMAPSPQLGALWALGRRLIVTYPDSLSYSNYIWTRNVHHLWGDLNDLNKLYNFMDKNIPVLSGMRALWSAMTEFTPDFLDILLDRWGGLRGAAGITNQPVTLWLRRKWWKMANIVAMDFYSSSDVISVAIEGNKILSGCKTHLDYDSTIQ